MNTVVNSETAYNAIDKAELKKYKESFVYFSKIRRSVKIRYADIIDNAEYEKYLLMILADDSLYYKNTVFCNAVMRTISSPAEKEPLKKFFSLYRVDSSNYLRAYNLISK